MSPSLSEVTIHKDYLHPTSYSSSSQRLRLPMPVRFGSTLCNFLVLTFYRRGVHKILTLGELLAKGVKRLSSEREAEFKSQYCQKKKRQRVGNPGPARYCPPSQYPQSSPIVLMHLTAQNRLQKASYVHGQRKKNIVIQYLQAPGFGSHTISPWFSGFGFWLRNSLFAASVASPLCEEDAISTCFR
jgi:hypothetical protein